MTRMDVVADLITRIGEAFPAISVANYVEGDHPAPFVTVSRQGGRHQDALLDRAGIGIYCWGRSELETHDLAEDVASVMENLPFSGGYSLVEMVSMRSDPDPLSKSPRWYLSYTITNFKPKEE